MILMDNPAAIDDCPNAKTCLVRENMPGSIAPKPRVRERNHISIYLYVWLFRSDLAMDNFSISCTGAIHISRLDLPLPVSSRCNGEIPRVLQSNYCMILPDTPGCCHVFCIKGNINKYINIMNGYKWFGTFKTCISAISAVKTVQSESEPLSKFSFQVIPERQILLDQLSLMRLG